MGDHSNITSNSSDPSEKVFSRIRSKKMANLSAFKDNNGGIGCDGVVPVSIEEIIKSLLSDVASLPMKTPVSILQEILSRQGITPIYDLVQIEGAIHEPTFRYRVSFADKDALGAGSSKKLAKHAAAKNLIDKLTGIPSDEVMLSSTTNGPDVLHQTFDDKIKGNPIGWLQEMCTNRRWPPPIYETEMEIGLAHERNFSIACKVLKFYEIGQGKSKKLAKRSAAQKMWTRLDDPQLDLQALGEEYLDERNQFTNHMNRYADLKDTRIPASTNRYSYKVAQFHKCLKSHFGYNLDKLQHTCLENCNVNYIEFLQELATEEHFEVTYVDIEERSYAGRFQCLIQLSTLPVAVCHGSGRTSKDAQANAARNALEYLKIMTKK